MQLYFLKYIYVFLNNWIGNLNQLQNSDKVSNNLQGAGDLGLVDVGEGEGFIEGRMDMESTDYPGTGANNHHDPRTPGRA